MAATVNRYTESTICQDLFGKSIAEVFPEGCRRNSEGFLNSYLETLVLVNQYVLNHPEALFLCDPTAFNNQCHLYALMVVQEETFLGPVTDLLISSIKMPASIAQLIAAYGKDSRYLILTLLLSYAFTDTSLLGRIAEKALKEMDMPCPEPKKAFIRQLKDPDGELVRAARSKLNRYFEAYLKTTLPLFDTPLRRELALLANEDLRMAPSSGPGTLYTFPKLAGVAYLIDSIRAANFTLLFKVKVITREGTGIFLHCNRIKTSIPPQTPLIVFEMVATGLSLSYLECREIAKRCPSHSRRNVSSSKRHKENESCLFCTAIRIDVTPFRERIVPILVETNQMLYALGADFVREIQREFLHFFNEDPRFPILTQLYKDALPCIERSYLSMTKPLSISVSHVYPERACNAFEETMVIDANYETLLKRKGLI